MQKAWPFIIIISLSCLFANNCKTMTFNDYSKEKNLSVLIAFDTKGVLTKQKVHLIKESISSRIKESFRGVVHLQELKLVDSIHLDNKNTQPLSASLLVTHENDHYVIKINFVENESNHIFPTQQATCGNRDEIPAKTLDLLRDYLVPKALITKKISDDLYELQFETNNQSKSDYVSPKKGDYFQIGRKTQTQKSSNVYKWTVLEITDVMGSSEKKLIFNSKLYSGIELPDLIGLNAIKIPSANIDVRFKILPGEQNQEMKKPETYFPVDVVLRHTSKVGTSQEKYISKTNDQGIFIFSKSSGQNFPGVAFIEIIRNSNIVALFPFFKTSNEQESITLSFEPEKPYDKQKAIWLLQINDQLAFMAALFRELNQPNFKDEELKTRIEKVEKLAKFSVEKSNSIRNGLHDLKLKWPDIATDNDLKLGEKKLNALFGYISELTNYQARLVKIEADKNSPQRKALEYKIAEARRMAGDGDFPEAIALLEYISTDAPEVESDIKYFKGLWLNKSPKVTEARKFLFDSLPNLNISELTRQSSKLISSVDTCISESDTAGLFKYQKHARGLYLLLDPSQNDPDKSSISPKESLELISLLEEQNKRVKIFFESLNKKP